MQHSQNRIMTESISTLTESNFTARENMSSGANLDRTQRAVCLCRNMPALTGNETLAFLESKVYCKVGQR